MTFKRFYSVMMRQEKLHKTPQPKKAVLQSILNQNLTRKTTEERKVEFQEKFLLKIETDQINSSIDCIEVSRVWQRVS